MPRGSAVLRLLTCRVVQNTKSVDPKPMSLALKVANGRNSKKTQTVGNATLDLVRSPARECFPFACLTRGRRTFTATDCASTR